MAGLSHVLAPAEDLLALFIDRHVRAGGYKRGLIEKSRCSGHFLDKLHTINRHYTNKYKDTMCVVFVKHPVANPNMCIY